MSIAMLVMWMWMHATTEIDKTTIYPCWTCNDSVYRPAANEGLLIEESLSLPLTPLPPIRKCVMELSYQNIKTGENYTYCLNPTDPDTGKAVKFTDDDWGRMLCVLAEHPCKFSSR